MRCGRVRVGGEWFLSKYERLMRESPRASAIGHRERNRVERLRGIAGGVDAL